MPLPEPGESIESQSFQRMTRGSMTACAYPRWSAPTVVCLQPQHGSKRRVGDESFVAVTVLPEERSRNLIHQKQRFWTIFRRTKNDSLRRLRLSSVRGPGSDRQGRFAPCRPPWQWTIPSGTVKLSSLCQSDKGPHFARFD